VKITKSQLRRIIKEELSRVLLERGAESYSFDASREGSMARTHGWYIIHADKEVEKALLQAREVWGSQEFGHTTYSAEQGTRSPTKDAIEKFEGALLLPATKFTNPQSSPEEKSEAKARYEKGRQAIVSKLPLLGDVIPQIEGDALVAPTSQKYLQE